MEDKTYNNVAGAQEMQQNISPEQVQPRAGENDVARIYEILAPMAGGYANAQAEQIGMAQRSMGPLAANTMGTTTAGLGNYTYNRLIRPQVETMRDDILVKGYTEQLNQLLSNALNNAKNNYNKSRSGGGGGNNGDTPDVGGSSGVTTISGSGDESTGTGAQTKYTYAQNSYQWQDDNGAWHTVRWKDYPSMSSVQWSNLYNSAKAEYGAKGRFKDGE